MDHLKDLRPVDYVLAAVLVGLAALLGFVNVTANGDAADLAKPLESQSPLIVPVFMAAALPILWRRRNVLAAISASFVVVAASIPAFGWVIRCGFALPLSIALAYAVARFAGSLQNHVVGLAGVLALQVVVLVRDASTGGLGALALSVPLAALAYGIGLFVQSRAQKRLERPTLAPEHVYA
jgi:hypothetical protein